MKYIITKTYEIYQEIEANSEREAIEKSYDIQTSTRLIKVSAKRFDDVQQSKEN